MDAFPDELLLEVLGRIDDGLTLLDVVPLVCKRWHRLSRDPGAWNSASVSILACRFSKGCTYWRRHENHDQILDAARVLIHAPALRRVSFDWSPTSILPFTCSYDRGTIASALDRCAAQVREIVFPHSHYCSFLNMKPEGLNLLADFLAKNSGCVRYLDLSHMLRAGAPLLHALGQCENLEELHLMLTQSDFFTYRGELRGRQLPKLKRLTLKSLSRVNDCRAFLRDLAGCVAQSVRHVRCEDKCQSSEEVLAELSQCVELRSLVCGVKGVALAGTLPRLGSLALVIVPYGQRHEALSAAERALHGCGELQDLCDLRLDSRASYDHKWDAEHIQAMSTLLTTFATKATNVKRLSVGELVSSLVSLETLRAFIKSLPRLESVHLIYEFGILPSLAEVEGLKRVSGEVSYRDGEADACHAALEQFKRQRPDVDCKLTDYEEFSYLEETFGSW